MSPVRALVRGLVAGVGPGPGLPDSSGDGESYGPCGLVWGQGVVVEGGYVGLGWNTSWGMGSVVGNGEQG